MDTNFDQTSSVTSERIENRSFEVALHDSTDTGYGSRQVDTVKLGGRHLDTTEFPLARKFSEVRVFRGSPSSDSGPQELVEAYDASVEELSAEGAQIAVTTVEGVKRFIVSLEGMRASGSGPINVGDQYTVKVFRKQGQIIPRFIKKQASTVIPFPDIPSPTIDPGIVAFQIRRFSENDETQ